jgi:hypothetical protein
VTLRDRKFFITDQFIPSLFNHQKIFPTSSLPHCGSDNVVDAAIRLR